MLRRTNHQQLGEGFALAVTNKAMASLEKWLPRF
jgi:hypothetical protein